MFRYSRRLLCLIAVLIVFRQKPCRATATAATCSQFAVIEGSAKCLIRGVRSRRRGGDEIQLNVSKRMSCSNLLITLSSRCPVLFYAHILHLYAVQLRTRKIFKPSFLLLLRTLQNPFKLIY